MKKKVILRGAIGIPTGITIGYLITIFSSLIWGAGYYSPCVPALLDLMDSEINAVILQTALCAILGMTFAAGSVIWEIEHWSIARQAGIYFAVTSLIMMPTAYLLQWMEHSIIGFLVYFGVFAVIFILIWLVQYLSAMCLVKKMNTKLKK